MDLISSFILSLLAGELFSRGAGFGEEKLKLNFKNRKLSEILDEYDQEFSKYYEKEIPNYEKEIQTVIMARDFLLPLAKEYMEKDNTDIESNLKQEFVETTCSKLWISSHIVQKYLDHFYDLVFIKETENIPVESRALFNRVADTVYGLKQENQDQEKRISDLEKADAESKDGKKTPADFSSYYVEVVRKFTAKKRGEYRNLVGEEPDETSYIDAFITKEGEEISALSFLEERFVKTEPGVILIHGEPGHGKTMLCCKASFEFYQKRFLTDKAMNVVAVSLNTGKNPRIIENRELKLENALVWGIAPKRTFSFEDCRGSLLFLDGFDEFIDKAKEANIRNIHSFMDTVDDIAAKNSIHIVVLSRTIAVTKDLEPLSRIYECYELSPITDEQQDKWLEHHKEYDDYREAFIELRNNGNMRKLLGVPFLFRLIVNNRFHIVTSNIVELYDDLFVHLMHKRGIDDKRTLETVKEELMNLAFEVYSTDTFMAKTDWNPQWVFAFYVKSDKGEKIGFFHQSFYQYFLAKYIHSGIINLTDENVEGFIGSFAERELDKTVRQYLAFMLKKEDESKVFPNIRKMIDALVSTEAYLNFTPHVVSGDAERSKILRSMNIYRNTLCIAALTSYVVQDPFKGDFGLVSRLFGSREVKIYSEKNNRANLRGINLSKTDLVLADLREVDLSGADLTGAMLIGANLSGAKLSGAKLIGANLNTANLCRANLMGADLCQANLFETNLIESNLCETNLCQTDMFSTYLSNANLSRAELFRANLNRATLFKANLSNANLNEAILSMTDLKEANLSGAALFNANLSGASLFKANLSGANLQEANLMRANLVEADLSGADLSGANLIEAFLSRLDRYRLDLKMVHILAISLNGAGLDQVYREMVRIWGDDLSRDDLNRVYQEMAHKWRTILSIADSDRFCREMARIWGADLIKTDLRRTNLTRAIINIRHKEKIDPSTEGYSSIRWVPDNNSNLC